MFARVAKLMGARVIVAGRNPMKLKAAEEFAHADEIIDLKNILTLSRFSKSFQMNIKVWMLRLNALVCQKFGNKF